MESIEKNPEFIEMKSSVDDSIKMLLKENGFSEKDEFVKGIVSIIDLVADYHEEGIKYFPEIIISDDADNFNTPLTTTVSFSESEDKAEIAFKKALKLCVPLAINGWVIYIILGEHIDFGLISAEKKETSLPLKDQVFLDSSEQHFLYLSNSGSRSVEIFSKTKNLIINLSLENNPISTDLNLRRLVNAIISQVNNDGNKETIETFINKTITCVSGKNMIRVN